MFRRLIYVMCHCILYGEKFSLNDFALRPKFFSVYLGTVLVHIYDTCILLVYEI